jgi:hypothetical protein
MQDYQFDHQEAVEEMWADLQADTVYGEPAAIEEFVGRCPACGDPIDYCQGHGEIGDPIGASILADHDAGNHDRCHEQGCEEGGD